MKPRLLYLLIVPTLAGACQSSGVSETTESGHEASVVAGVSAWERFGPEILEMAEKDQELRTELIEWMRAHPGKQPDMVRGLAVAEADRVHTTRLKELVRAHGWPRSSAAGEDVSHAAWLIAQHATQDRPFMRDVLSSMQEYLADDDASPQDFALLFDRVQTGQGMPQRYGTQWQPGTLNGKPAYVPVTPIADSGSVNQRRAEMGMGTIEEYLEALEEMYGPLEQM